MIFTNNVNTNSHDFKEECKRNRSVEKGRQQGYEGKVKKA